MEIVPLGPGFAAELRGVTLRDVAADDAAYAAVRAAFEEHSVLVFRGKDVADEGQLAFSCRFGPPEITKVGSASAGTLGSGGGGGAPSRLSSTHLPRSTGEVRVGKAVTIRIPACVRMPPRSGPVTAMRRK